MAKLLEMAFALARGTGSLAWLGIQQSGLLLGWQLAGQLETASALVWWAGLSAWPWGLSWEFPWVTGTNALGVGVIGATTIIPGVGVLGRTTTTGAVVAVSVGRTVCVGAGSLMGVPLLQEPWLREWPVWRQAYRLPLVLAYQPDRLRRRQWPAG